jgi:NosR/NirI family transcriptional regulator, nitrous oxide reductase regulator
LIQINVANSGVFHAVDRMRAALAFCFEMTMAAYSNRPIPGVRPRRDRRVPPLVVVLAAALCLLTCLGSPSKAEARLPEFLKTLKLDDVFPGANRLGPVAGTPPAAPAYAGDQLLGYIYLNSDVVNSTGYSGKPISILVGLSLDGKIVGTKLVDHHEPIVLVGIPETKIQQFIHGYVGLNYSDIPSAARKPPVDIISGATVTTLVIGDTITRSAMRVARSRKLGGAEPELAATQETGTLDQTVTSTRSWESLVGDGSARRLVLSVGDINEAFERSGNQEAIAHPEAGDRDETFIDLNVGLASVPSIGRSLLGDAAYEQMKQSLKPGQQAIVLAANGRYSFKGSGYVRGGIFDRIEITQGESTIRFHDRDQTRLGSIAAEGAPSFKEISLFVVPNGAAFDPTAAWRLQLLVQRAIGARDKAFLTFDLDYSVPTKYVKVERPPTITASEARSEDATTAAAKSQSAEVAATLEEPLWQRIWRSKIAEIGVLCVALLFLTAIFFFQDILAKRPVLYDRIRIGYLVFTLFWIGWYTGAQLSVVNVLTFLSALRTDFRWDYFLMDPLIFILWFAVATSALFWNRGTFCGWLCPFGALQELTNRGARLLRLPQLVVPFAVHQRLWVIKYVIFLVLFGLSLHSLSFAEKAAEVEPFKTAIVLHFLRAWPFVAFAVVLLVAGLFIERFYCRYMCPLGAALAISARLRIFDWLRRYRECGNPCQRCANECPVQAIHPEGHINPNECIQCLHCQMLYHHDQKCPVMIQKRLKLEKREAMTSPSMKPEAARAHKAASTTP